MRPNKAKSLFEGVEYPATTDELVDAVGDVEIELPVGTETIADVFDRVDGETYAGPSDAFATFMSGLSTKAIGRRGYTDRDPPAQPAIDPLFAEDSRHDADGPHCGVCTHLELVGDWTAVGFCAHRDAIVEPVVDDVCGEFAPVEAR